MTLTISVDSVRDYLDNVSATTANQYSDGTIGSNILMAQSLLEQATGRYFVDRTFTDVAPWYATTMNHQSIALPGFRTITSVTRLGSALTLNGTYWLTPDALQTGVYTGMAFRAATSSDFWPGQPGTPYGPWITNPAWFDQAADSPFYPGNVGGAIYLTSMPNDLAIAGSAGYSLPADGTQGSMPYDFQLAVRAEAAWLTMRGPTIMADVGITPQGGVLTYSASPPEVRAFITQWKSGTQMSTVG